MNTNDHEILASVLDRLDRCPVCHHTHHLGELNVVRRDEQFWLVEVVCTECHRTSHVAAVLEQGSAAEARRALRELDHRTHGVTHADEIESDTTAASVSTSHPVAADDVLEIHAFLRDFDGDFKRLFRRPRG
jgi:hypothetical protein